MTASQWFDLAVIAVAFGAALSGWRSGAFGSVMAFVGVVLGAVAGLLLFPYVVEHITGPRTKLFVALFLILGLVVVGEVAGVVVGGAVRGAIRNPTHRTVDSIVGVAVQVVAVLAAAWLLATALRTSGQETLARAFEGSMIRKEVDKVAPGWLKQLPTNLSKELLTPLTDVWQPFDRPSVHVDAPNENLAGTPVVAATQPSVVRIRGLASGCQKELKGSGFVIAPNRVMSNAHVVAGADSVTVELDGNSYEATVVSYDPNADISILDVPDLTAQQLTFTDSPVDKGTDALVLGYPGGGDFVATPARIRDVIELNGPDIYNTTTVKREVYMIRGVVRQGDSGGPLIALDGGVLGVVFGAAVDDPETGFVLTANEVARQMASVNNTQAVATGPCIS